MNIFEKIGLIFKTTINKWFTKLVDCLHNNAAFIHHATDIVANVNNFVQGTEADILTAIIPGTLDDGLKMLARTWLPRLITELNFFGTCAQKTTANEILECFVNNLSHTSPEQRAFIMHNLASFLAQRLSDGKLTLPEIYGVIEAQYQSITKPKLLNTVAEN